MVAAITMVRDEADIVAETVGHMRSQVDMVIAADNGSTDETRAILERLDVWVLDDPDVGYYQSAKMSHLATVAAGAGADWIIPFDADEFWVAKPSIRESLTRLTRKQPAVLVCEAPIFDHVATAIDEGAAPVDRMGWRRAEPNPLRKVACRYREGMVIAQGNHSVIYPGEAHPATVTNLLEVHHFPYRSPEQFIRKARNGAEAYAATDLPQDMGGHWRAYGRMSDEDLREHFYRWFWRDTPEAPLTIGSEHQPALVYEPVQ